jgi:peptidyl-prolyl cis-trans isomerase SurA
MAVVGNEVVLLSDLQARQGQIISNRIPYQGDLTCASMEALLFEKLMLHQSKVDSLIIPEEQIQAALSSRIAMFSEQLGGEDKLEAFYGKSIAQIREEFHDPIKEQLTIQQMQQTLMSGIKITPADVEDFYNSIPEDSIPLIDSEVEVAQIVIKPIPRQTEIDKVKAKLEEYKKQVMEEGRDFATLAVLYSEDPGSATKGGELGLVGRGRMVPEFEQVAYNLEEGEISNVFKSDYGYHLMQLIERKGDFYNARHILLTPKVSRTDLDLAKNKLDSIKSAIEVDSLTFAQAAVRFSDDEGTRNNNGIIINPNTGSIRFKVDELDPQLFLVIDKMEVGEISDPVIIRSISDEEAYRIVQLRFRSDAHRADHNEDYQLLQNMARNGLTDEAMRTWTEKTIARTYIRVDDELGECNFQREWGLQLD